MQNECKQSRRNLRLIVYATTTSVMHKYMQGLQAVAVRHNINILQLHCIFTQICFNTTSSNYIGYRKYTEVQTCETMINKP